MKFYVNHANQFKANAGGLVMKFLEEAIWRENNIIFSDQIKIWAGNKEHNFFIRSYRSKIKCVWEGVGHKCGHAKKLREG